MTSKKPTGEPPSHPFRIQVLNRQRRYAIFPRVVESLCFRVLQILRESACSSSVTFVGPRRIRLLNRLYRGKDYPADVLTFRYAGESLEGQPLLVASVILPEVASRNARQWNASLKREVGGLLLHV